MMINIKILLDICDITYTEKQLLKLEKLVNDLLQLHIKEPINDFYATNSNLDQKLENEIGVGEVENDVFNKVAVKIEEVNSSDKDILLFKKEISEEATTDIKSEGFTYEINDLTDNDEYEEEITLSEAEQIPLNNKRGSSYQKKKCKNGKLTYHEYSCSSCCETLTSLKKYELHIKEIHDDEVSYHLCKVCDKKFTLYSDFESHFALVHQQTKPKRLKEVNINQCSECKKTFTSKRHLKQHLNGVHKKSFCCHKCGISVSRKEALEEHLLLHDGIKSSQCDLCDSRYTSEMRLKQHKRLAHRDRVHDKICHICSKACGPNWILKQHIQMVHGSKDQKCQHCDKCFGNKSDLTRHMLQHDKKFKCNICDIKFARKDVLDLHMKRKHCEVKPFKCEKCGDEYAIRFDLEQHTKESHDKTRPFECEKCLKTFNVKKGLDLHIAKDHLSKKDCVICPYCEKPVKNLRNHTRDCKSKWPGGKTPRIECPNKCGKIIGITGLSGHKKRCKLKVVKPVVIKTIDSVKCYFCEQIIGDYTQRKHHYIKKHFFCTICEEKLESREEIIEHLTDQHDQKLSCEFCQYSTFVQSDVKTHVKRMHKNKGN